jgi:hypothetical protein
MGPWQVEAETGHDEPVIVNLKKTCVTGPSKISPASSAPYFFLSTMAPASNTLKRKARESNDEIPTGNAGIKKKIRDTERALRRVSEIYP